MRTNRRFLLSAAAIVAIVLPLLLSAASAHAQDSGGVTIVVIDTQRIYREAVAVKGLQKVIDEQRSDYQGELRKKEESLRAADQELARQRTILSSEAFTEKRRQLEEQVATLQRDVQSRRKGLEEVFVKGMSQVQKTLVEISQEIAKERAADLVIEKSAVVLVKPEFEITKEALKRLNKRLPKVDLKAAAN